MNKQLITVLVDKCNKILFVLCTSNWFLVHILYTVHLIIVNNKIKTEYMYNCT